MLVSLKEVYRSGINFKTRDLVINTEFVVSITKSNTSSVLVEGKAEPTECSLITLSGGEKYAILGTIENVKKKIYGGAKLLNG